MIRTCIQVSYLASQAPLILQCCQPKLVRIDESQTFTSCLLLHSCMLLCSVQSSRKCVPKFPLRTVPSGTNFPRPQRKALGKGTNRSSTCRSYYLGKYWENIKGLKILVDDDVVQHIPEDQIMTAEFCEVPGAETAPFSGVKPSAVEIKLKF